jgi:hypothetical protein
MSDKPLDLSQRRAALAEVRKNELIALRAHFDNMLECGAIIAEAIEQMWDAGADRSEIVQALRWATEKMGSFDDNEVGKQD